MLSPSLSTSYALPSQQDFIIYDHSNVSSHPMASQQGHSKGTSTSEPKLKSYHEDIENLTPGPRPRQFGSRYNGHDTRLALSQSVNALGNVQDDILYTNPAKPTAISAVRPPSGSYNTIQEGYLPRTSTPRLSVPPGFETSLSTSAHSNQCHQCSAGLSVMLLTPCGHRICQHCMTLLITRNLSSICSCSLCGEHILCFVSTGMQHFKTGEPAQSYSSNSVPLTHAYKQSVSPAVISGEGKLSECPLPASPHEGPSSFADNAEDLSLHHNLFHDLSQLAKPHDYIVVKISNIPWDSTVANVQEFLGKNCRLPPVEDYAQSIHITMDRMSGKTSSDCYVEFASLSDAQRVVQRKHNRLLGSRNVSVSIATKEELMKIIFPKWRGEWRGVDPYVTEEIMAERHFNIPDAPFVTREELNSILVHAKIYKSPYSKKCPERPYESIISIMVKFPWHRADFYTAMHRDHLFEALKKSLRNHINKGILTKLDTPLLERLVYSGLQNAVFTEKQKLVLLHTARMNCPENMLHLIASPLMQSHSEVHDKENSRENGFQCRAVTITPQSRLALQPITRVPLGQIGAETSVNTKKKHLGLYLSPVSAESHLQHTLPLQQNSVEHIHQVLQQVSAEPQQPTKRDVSKTQKKEEMMSQKSGCIPSLQNGGSTARLLNPSTAKLYIPLLDLSKVDLTQLKVRAEELGIQRRTGLEIQCNIKGKNPPTKDIQVLR